MLFPENLEYTTVNKAMLHFKYNVIAETKTVLLLGILFLLVWLLEKQLQPFEGDQWIEIQSICSNMSQVRFLIRWPNFKMHAFISSAINWKRWKVKREKQEIKTKSESTEISVVDDLSEYLIENRFATDAQKTGFEIRLSALIG